LGARRKNNRFVVAASAAKNAKAFTTNLKGKPADASIIAIVDSIEKDGQYIYQKAREER
jgi:microcompartment protein CcmK/EutM